MCKYGGLCILRKAEPNNALVMCRVGYYYLAVEVAIQHLDSSMHKRSSSRAASTKDKQATVPLTSSSSCTSELAIAGAQLHALISEATTIVNEASEGKTNSEPFPWMLREANLFDTDEGLIDKIETSAKGLRTSAALVQLLEQVDSTTAEPEAKRIAAKVDRALERLRRSASAWLERHSATRDRTCSTLKELLLAITSVLELAIQEVGPPNTARNITLDSRISSSYCASLRRASSLLCQT